MLGEWRVSGKNCFIILSVSYILLAFAIGFLSGLVISDVIAYNYVIEIQEIARADIE
jgi:uncharacterized membrane protein (DUF485 family)